MGRAKALTKQAYWWVIGQHDGGVLLYEILRKIGHSRTFCAAVAGDPFAAGLKTNLSIKTLVRAVQRLFQRVDHLVYIKMDRTLPLTAAHKTARMGRAEEHILDPVRTASSPTGVTRDNQSSRKSSARTVAEASRC
ncbi:hypothetical protein F444_05487, partial [Phytophthora nicotianae P1976]